MFNHADLELMNDMLKVCHTNMDSNKPEAHKALSTATLMYLDMIKDMKDAHFIFRMAFKIGATSAILDFDQHMALNKVIHEKTE